MTWNRWKFITMRKELGLSQTEVGEWLGVCQKSISNWEAGNFAPTYSTRQVLADKIALMTNSKVAVEVTGIRSNQLILKPSPIKLSRPKKIVIVEFEGKTETYEYETDGILEHIAENLEWIKSIQILECKSFVEVNDE
tara:strand:- start:854 stop:1267 length:414 start_codon:yes stop_codon:yes gene_type:complete